MSPSWQSAQPRASLRRNRGTAMLGNGRLQHGELWQVTKEIRQEQVKPVFKGSHSLALTMAALASLAAYSVHSVVDFNLHIPANTFVMAFVFALLANPGTQSVYSGNGKKTDRTWTSWLGLTLPAVGVALAVAALPNWPAEYFGEKARRVLSHHEFMASPELARKAENLANEALRHDPRNPEIYYFLGESHVALAEMSSDATERNAFYTSSVDAYRKALDLMPQDVRLVLCLVWSLDALKRFAEAELALQRALELDPNSIKVWNSMRTTSARRALIHPTRTFTHGSLMKLKMPINTQSRWPHKRPRITGCGN